MSKEQIRALSLPEKLTRMEAFLTQGILFRLGHSALPTVHDISQTKCFLEKTEKGQTKMIWQYFDLLLEMEYLFVYMQLSNAGAGDPVWEQSRSN